MVSVTDPDSRHIKANEAYVQGYNAQAVVDENQIVLAAEITNSTVDFSQLDPMITAALGELDAGRRDRPARRSPWRTRSTGTSSTWTRWSPNKHIQVLIPPDSGARTRRGPAGPAGATQRCAASWPPRRARRSTEDANR